MRTFFFIAAGAGFVLGTALLSAQAWSEPLDLAEALQEAAKHHPDLRAFSLKETAVKADLASAALAPPTVVNLELENLARSDGVGAAEVTLTFSSLLDLRRQRNARKNAARARHRQMADEQRVAAVDIFSLVNREFVALQAAHARRELAAEAEDMSATALTTLEKAARVGGVPAADLLRVKAALAKRRIAATSAARKVEAQALALSVLIGGEREVSAAKGDFWKLAPPLSLAETIIKARSNPDLELLGANLQASDAELASARAAGVTPVEWQAGIRYLEEADAAALVVGLSVPLRSGSRNRSTVAKLQAERDMAEIVLTSAEASVARRVHLLHAAYTQAREEATALREQVLPLNQALVKAVMEDNRKGRLSVYEVIQAQQELITAKEALIEATLSAHLALIELHRLTAAADLYPEISP